MESMQTIYSDTRKSGIPLIGDLPWGTDFCQFYQTEEDLFEILAPYFKAGVESNELCIWITSGPFDSEDACTALETFPPHFKEYVDKGQMVIIPRSRWWARYGRTDEAVVSMLDRAILSGFDGLRLAYNAFPEEGGGGGIILDGPDVISRHNIIALFSYPRDEFDAAGFMQAIKNHRFALVRNGDRWELIESSEVRTIKDALKRSEEKLHSLFNNMSEGFAYHRIVLDAGERPCDYVFCQVNEAFERLTGLKAESILGRKATDVLPGIEKDPADWIGTYGRVALTGRPVQFERYSELLEKWFSISAFSPHKGYFAVTFSDITERKRAEQALRESEQLWAVTVASIGDAVIATDTAGRVTFLNKVAEELTGWNMPEALGKPVQEVFHIVNENSREAVEDPVRKVLQTGKIAGLANHTVLLRRDGTEVPIDDSGAPIRDNEGRILGVVLVFRDITERRSIEAALRQLNEVLERRVAERTEMAETRSKQLQALAAELIEAEERERRRVAEILHDDLQQLLAAARMQLQAAREDLFYVPLLENVEQLLEESIGKSRRLSHELSPAVLHHSGLVAALEWLARQMKDQFGLEVELEADDTRRFEGSPLKVFLFRAAQELLFNVVKHAGVKHARVALSGFDAHVVMKITDCGQGFDPEVLDCSTRMKGFGLLSLRERARYVGGNLDIESAPGCGSRFTVRVPLNLPEADRLQPYGAPPSEPRNSGQAGGQGSTVAGGTRVLLVDDHQVMRQGLNRLISGHPDIRVVGEAANGHEAIEGVRQLKPHVVVMDVSMPVMDGIEATRRIKAESPEVRVIGLSMYEDELIADTMRQAGAEALVSKTASSAELLKAICRVVGRG
ncbi:MAG: PAS domain S-box protein [Deltaproteobacteria bacterium]|nr:PAS domain S-box protein [Deltaproteobacteria bacterium]